MFSKHINSFHTEVERAGASGRTKTYTKLLKHIVGDVNKISRADLEARKEKHSKGMDKTRKVIKSEQSKCAADVHLLGIGRGVANTQRRMYLPEQDHRSVRKH